MKTAEITIRKAVADDAEALSALFCESWQQAYCGIIPHLHLQRMIRQRTPAWWTRAITKGERTLVLELAGQIGGYVSFGKNRWPLPYQGEIYELYLLPDYQGLGFGEHLFEACRHQLDQRKLKGLIVWALFDNTPAIDFYWRRGGRPIGRTFDKIGGSKLEKIAFAWG